ncbi:MAG: penicillin acylase family protein [Myxococcota bacterium]
MRRALIAGIGLIVAVGGGWPLVRMAMAPSVPDPGDSAREHARNVRILRDRFGVPHVFGVSDADAAFGLAWAHAEDDWPMIQGVLAASRGQLGLHLPGQRSLANDYYARFVDVDGEVERHWDELDPHVQAVFQAYAEGLNLYAWHHPDEANARLLPLDGTDVARGFVHKLPLMMGVDRVLKALGDGSDRPVGEPVFPGSNAHAIAPWRSADGVTRLNINSHQPWEGPVTWYEAHVHSEEGWNAAGGTFPGAPMILHGHNDHVGWAMTVNRPDRADVYALEIEGDRYRWEGGWADLETVPIWLPLETPWGTLQIPQTLRRSAHGPVFERGERPYAVRWPSMDQGVAAAEQWFRMNKAGSVREFQEIMEGNHIPMFNLVYADAEHIGFVYNARIPVRTPGWDYTTVLPGDVAAALWTEFVPYLALPQVTDPASGFVQACNSAPWIATLGRENPRRVGFPEEMGIESVRTNRTQRTLELLDDGAKLDRDAFLALKWDRGTARDAPLRRKLLDTLDDWEPTDPDLVRAKEILLAWDGEWDEGSTGAALAALAWKPLKPEGDDVEDGWRREPALQRAVAHLREHFGTLEVPLGDLQRLHRGEVDLPLGGGPDVLNCTYTEVEGAHLVGDQGDSYVMIVELGASGVRSASIHQYGASSRPGSPHFADQAPLFVSRRLKPVLRDEAVIRQFLEAEYHPGEPWEARAIDPEVALAEALALGVW